MKIIILTLLSFSCFAMPIENCLFAYKNKKYCNCIQPEKKQTLADLFKPADDKFLKKDLCLSQLSSEEHQRISKLIWNYEILTLFEDKLARSISLAHIASIKGMEIAQSFNSCILDLMHNNCNRINSILFSYKCLSKEKKNEEKYYKACMPILINDPIQLNSENLTI